MGLDDVSEEDKLLDIQLLSMCFENFAGSGELYIDSREKYNGNFTM